MGVKEGPAWGQGPFITRGDWDGPALAQILQRAVFSARRHIATGDAALRDAARATAAAP